MCGRRARCLLLGEKADDTLVPARSACARRRPGLAQSEVRMRGAARSDELNKIATCRFRGRVPGESAAAAG